MAETAESGNKASQCFNFFKVTMPDQCDPAVYYPRFFYRISVKAKRHDQGYSTRPLNKTGSSELVTGKVTCDSIFIEIMTVCNKILGSSPAFVTCDGIIQGGAKYREGVPKIWYFAVVANGKKCYKRHPVARNGTSLPPMASHSDWITSDKGAADGCDWL